jgi:hypothetical protein
MTYVYLFKIEPGRKIYGVTLPSESESDNDENVDEFY